MQLQDSLMQPKIFIGLNIHKKKAVPFPLKLICFFTERTR